MNTVGVALLAPSGLAAVAVVVAVVAGFRRRWGLAVLVSRTIALGGPCVLLVALAVVVARAGGNDAPATATALAVGISELMNCGVILLLAVLASAVIWAVGARQRRREMRRAGDT